MDKKNNFLIFMLAFGTFGILTTEMGFVGILPLLSNQFNISVSDAGMFVSIFALGVAIAGLFMPLIFSKFNYKKSLLLVLGIFIISNISFIFVSDFKIALILRLIPSLFHPIFCSLSLTLASELVGPDESLKAVSKVIMGVSAGMILGVPIVNFLGSTFSLTVSMAFMAIINIISFITLLVFMPSIYSKKEISYGNQLKVLKKPVFLLSIIGVIFLTAGLYSVYSFISVYMISVNNINGILLTLTLFLYGIASIGGNYLGGNLLSKIPIKTVTIFPIILAIVYMLIYGFTGNMIIILSLTLFWGVIAGVGNNIQQYWIVSGAKEAPEFANGVFLSSGNIGVTIGTTLSGLLIAGVGVKYIIFGAFLFLLLDFIFVIIRNYFNGDLSF